MIGILLVLGFTLFWLALYSIFKSIFRPRSASANQTPVKARHSYPLRCPHCGHSYEASWWLREEPVDKLLRCSQRCMRHYYVDGQKIGRTPEENQLLAAEARDVARVRSDEFRDVILKAYDLYNHSYGHYSHIYFESDHIEYTDVKAYGGPKTVVAYKYPWLETDAGRQQLAMACMEYAQAKSPYQTFDLGDYLFGWERQT